MSAARLQERYRWEAQTAAGEIITTGGDLSECVRVSLVPAVGLLLPRHDIIGVPLQRRFGRGFIKLDGRGLSEYLHCVVCRGFRIYVRSSDGSLLVTPEACELYL
jgi:hypothetical protein